MHSAASGQGTRCNQGHHVGNARKGPDSRPPPTGRTASTLGLETRAARGAWGAAEEQWPPHPAHAHKTQSPPAGLVSIAAGTHRSGARGGVTPDPRPEGRAAIQTNQGIRLCKTVGCASCQAPAANHAHAPAGAVHPHHSYVHPTNVASQQAGGACSAAFVPCALSFSRRRIPPAWGTKKTVIRKVRLTQAGQWDKTEGRAKIWGGAVGATRATASRQTENHKQVP